MKILHATPSQTAWHLAVKTLHKNGGSLYQLREHSPKAGAAAENAIKELQSQLDSSKKNETITLSIKYLESITSQLTTPQDLPKGTEEAMEVLELQKSLKKCGLSAEQKKQIFDKIVGLFKSLEDDYPAIQVLKNAIEAHSSGSSRLHLLVYHDLDVAHGHEVILTINNSFTKALESEDTKAKIQFSYMIYSDVDDTVQASLNDRQTNIQGFYPGALEFYKALTTAHSDVGSKPPVNVTFLSARPEAAKTLWNKIMKRAMPEDLKFFGLYGSTGAFIEGIKYYLKKLVAQLVGVFLPQLYNKILDKAGSEMVILFALDKRRNIDRDLLLRPEMRPIMIGDCGEGDLLFLLSKNTGTPNPVDDERIPPEIKLQMEEKQGPLARAQLQASFAHAISSPMEYGTERPDPKWRKEYEEELHTYVFNNYVDNALYALNKGILTKEAAAGVVKSAETWLEAERSASPFALNEGESDDMVSPARRYRILLEQSIQAFYANPLAK